MFENSANFSTRVVATLEDIRAQANAIEINYAPLSSPTFTGTVDFTSASVTGIDLLPNQSGQNGKFLSTNGTSALWETLSLNFDNDQNIIANRVFG